MNQIYQSTVLHALGWAIAGSLWQMALLWMVYQLCIALPFRKRPSVKHAFAITMLVIGSTWFIIHFVQQYRVLTQGATILTNKPGTVTVNKWPSMPGILNFYGLIETYIPYFSTAYLLILGFLSTRLLRKIVLINRIFPGAPASGDGGEWQEMADSIRGRISMAKPVLVYLSREILVPATYGILRPVILLPIASVNQLTVSQVEAILLHEIAHIRRYDFLLNIVVSSIEILLFFNPFVHLLGLTIRKEREHCCDDFVVHYQRNPQDYAYALLSLEKNRHSASLALAASGNHSYLLERVKRILNIPGHPVYFRYRVLALFGLAGLIMLFTHLQPADNHSPFDDRKAYKMNGVNGSFHSFRLPFTFHLNDHEPLVFPKSGSRMPGLQRVSPDSEKSPVNTPPVRSSSPGKPYPSPLASLPFITGLADVPPETDGDAFIYSSPTPPLPPNAPLPPSGLIFPAFPVPERLAPINYSDNSNLMVMPDGFLYRSEPMSPAQIQIIQKQAEEHVKAFVFSNEEEKFREFNGLISKMKTRTPAQHRKMGKEDQAEAMLFGAEWPRVFRDGFDNDLLRDKAMAENEGSIELQNNAEISGKDMTGFAQQNRKLDELREKLISARKQRLPDIITEDGVTIKIIQDARQIEITVKNKR